VVGPGDEQLAVLGRVVDALGSVGIDDLVSGSIAASYYARPRMTHDVDIVLDLRLEHVPALAAALAYHREEFDRRVERQLGERRPEPGAVRV